jgi:hypothetical protein
MGEGGLGPRVLVSFACFLGGKRPQDFLATEPERIVAAAADEAQEVAHG